MIRLSLILWFWQTAATPTPTPQTVPNSDISNYLLFVMTAVFSFIIGVLITSVYFFLTRPKTQNELVINQMSEARIPIKQCPKCNSTYTDEDLKFCLRDGLTLKIVGSMPIPTDSNKIR